jgi:5-formaminoimidazole-4-carboxamide-1-beta-D-ribofuranosyl 5'-monophosphate synthetase
MPVTDLTVEQLERDVTHSLVERGALESARRVKSIMGMVLKLPFKKRLITYNPAYDITLPKPIKGNHNAIVRESELKMLLQNIGVIIQKILAHAYEQSLIKAFCLYLSTSK